MSSAQVLAIVDEHLLFSYLDEYMNAHGIPPKLAGTDMNNTPFLAWLNEYGGDSVYMSITKLESMDDGTGEYPVTEAPGQGETSSLRYPVRVLELNPGIEV